MSLFEITLLVTKSVRVNIEADNEDVAAEFAVEDYKEHPEVFEDGDVLSVDVFDVRPLEEE